MKKQNMNAIQINILVNRVGVWAHDRAVAAKQKREDDEVARTKALSEAFTSGAVKLKEYSPQEFKFHYTGGEKVHVTFEGQIDTKKTSKEVMRLLETQRECDRSRYANTREASVELPWADRYRGASITCLVEDKGTVTSALDMIATVILGADAIGVTAKLDKLLK